MSFRLCIELLAEKKGHRELSRKDKCQGSTNLQQAGGNCLTSSCLIRIPSNNIWLLRCLRNHNKETTPPTPQATGIPRFPTLT